MKYSFSVYQMQVDDHLFWVTESDVLKGCVAQGETIEEALNEFAINEEVWLETAMECGIPVPNEIVKKESLYSGKLTLRISKSVHETASKMASIDGISLNQYINDAIVEKNTGNSVTRTILATCLLINSKMTSSSKTVETPTKISTNNELIFHQSLKAVIN